MSDTSRHSIERYLNTPFKKAKMCKLKERVCIAEKQNHMLKTRIVEITQKVISCLHRDLLTIMNENHDQIKWAYPEGSFAPLFWEEQLKAALVKDP